MFSFFFNINFVEKYQKALENTYLQNISAHVKLKSEMYIMC